MKIHIKYSIMKKSIFLLVLVAVSSGALFQSCNGNGAKKMESSEIAEAEVSPNSTINEKTEDPQQLTIKNMHDAYKGETTAHFKYAAYSKKAEEEGHPEIALLFKAASGAELIHANNHKVVLKRMGESIPEITPEFTVMTTAENLKEANERILKKNQELEFQKDEITNQAEQLQKINIDLIKLSKVASETDNAIVIFDKNGDIEWVNNGFTRMYGYTLEQFKTEKHVNIIGSSENPNINEAIRKCIEEKKSIIYELETKTREGKTLWAQTTLTHVIDKNKATINLIAIETDITKLKLAEEEIIKQKKKIEKQRDLLEISNATKTKFFRIIAHDLRNPISTLVSSTSIVLHDIKYYNKDKTTSFISELNKLSQTTYILLENLLDWSSSQMGEIPFSPKNIDINLIVKENIDLILTKTQSKHFRLYVNMPEPTLVFADENMIKAVIRNILSNATKFTPNNGLIDIYITEENGFIKLHIQDSGIGMNETDLNKLFRTEIHHSTLGTSNEKGSGLGLILCKEFIEKNGGTLSVISKPQKGSTFSFTIKKA